MSDGAACGVANDEREKHDDDAGRSIDGGVALAEAQPSPPPDGGYGWVCVLACFCVNAFTWGVVAVGHYSPSPTRTSQRKPHINRFYTPTTD